MASEPAGIEPRRLLSALWRQRLLVGGVTAACVLVAALYSLLAPPIYESETWIHVTPERPEFRVGTDMLPMGLPSVPGLGGETAIQTDIAVLNSRYIAEAVVDSLHLNIRVLEPRVPRDSLFIVHRGARPDEPVTLELIRDGNTYRVDGAERGALRITPGVPFALADAVIELAPAGGFLPEEIRLEIEPYRTTVLAVQQNLDVYKPDMGARVIAIRFRSQDRLMAAAVPNTAREAFIGYKTRVNLIESNSAIRFLEQQAAQYEQQLAAAETELRDYREEAQVVEPTTQASEQVRQLIQLQATRNTLDAERQALRQLLSNLEPPGTTTANETSPYRQLAAFPAFLGSGPVQRILEELITIETERAELAVRRTEENPDIQAYSHRINALERQLFDLAASYIRALDAQISALDQGLARFDQQLETIPQREVEYFRLLRQQELLTRVHYLIETRLKEAQIQAASEPANLQVVDAALVPRFRAFPKRKLNLVLGFVLGAILGSLAALTRAYFDRRVYTIGDVLAVTGGLPVLAAVPAGIVRGGPSRMLPPARRLLPGMTARRNGKAVPGAEPFRLLRNDLLAEDGSAQRRSILFVPASEGASPAGAVVQLGAAFARVGRVPLLVDADLWTGSLHEVLGTEKGPGLSDALRSDREAEEYVSQTHIHADALRVSVVPRGTAEPGLEPFAGDRWPALFGSWRRSHEISLVVAPSSKRLADVAVLAAAVDLVIVVAEAGDTEADELATLVDRLRAMRADVGGVVLTDASYPGVA